MSLFDHYKPLTPIPPYRISVPSRGVFLEAVQGAGALRATSQIAIAAVPMNASPGLTVPQSFAVVAGESTPLLASIDPVAFTGSGNLTVTVGLTNGALTTDVAGLASPPAITAVTTSGRVTSITVVGTVNAIRSLMAEGRVRYVGQAADTVQMSVQSVGTPALRADSAFAISIVPTSGNRASPAIAVAERIALQPAGNTVIQFVNTPFAAARKSTRLNSSHSSVSRMPSSA